MPISTSISKLYISGNRDNSHVMAEDESVNVKKMIIKSTVTEEIVLCNAQLFATEKQRMIFSKDNLYNPSKTANDQQTNLSSAV